MAIGAVVHAWMKRKMKRRVWIALIAVVLVSIHQTPTLAVRRGGSVPKAAQRSGRVDAPKPKLIDPELKLKDCADSCLKDLFHGNYRSIKLPSVKGEFRDASVIGNKIFLLVKNFNLISDAIFTIRSDNGKIQSIWGIGKHDAQSMACDGSLLWILSKSNRYFLRKLTLDGKPAGDVTCLVLPEGTYRGLTIAGGSMFFVACQSDGSRIYRFNPSTCGIAEIYASHGGIHAMAFREGFIIAYLREFDTYAEDWLLVLDANGALKNKIRFVERMPLSFSSDGRRLYMLEQHNSEARLLPIAIVNNTGSVLADPRLNRVEITYNVTGRAGRRFSGTLWMPYPMNRQYQNVRRVSISPQPREITVDRYGNRWAAVQWEHASGTVKAVLTFDVLTAARAETIRRGIALNEAEVPDTIRETSCRETEAFNLSHYVVKSHATRLIPEGPWLSRVLAIRDYVNAAVRHSYFDDRWGKASDYLYKGRGDDYGHTVAFIALARRMGMPARAVGGIMLDRERREFSPLDGESWSQVYLPGTGWIDLGFPRGDGDVRMRFSSRPSRCVVLFEGDFDRCDYANVFAEKGWLGVLRSSIGADGVPDAELRSIQLATHVLEE